MRKNQQLVEKYRKALDEFAGLPGQVQRYLLDFHSDYIHMCGKAVEDENELAYVLAEARNAKISYMGEFAEMFEGYSDDEIEHLFNEMLDDLFIFEAECYC